MKDVTFTLPLDLARDLVSELFAGLGYSNAASVSRDRLNVIYEIIADATGEVFNRERNLGA